MNEVLNLSNLEAVSIESWDFLALKNEIEKILEKYNNMVYTEDDLSEAKNDRTELNAVTKKIEDRRKEFKKKCLEPYDVVEPKVKEITKLLEASVKNITEFINAVDARQKEEKKNEVENYYNQKSSVLSKYADNKQKDRIFNRIFDPKWLNKTKSRRDWQSELIDRISRVSSDLEEISSIETNVDKNALIEYYINNHTVDEVKEENQRLSAIVEKSSVNVVQPHIKAPERDIKPAEDEIVIRIKAGDSERRKLFDFMKALGIKFEVVQEKKYV